MAVVKYKVAYEAVEKYTNFSDLYDEASKSDAVFTRDARGEPVVEVIKVHPNSIVDRIGLKKGDKVRSVNGYQIRNQDDAIALYKKLKNERSFTVEINRGGRVMYFYYQITK